MKKTLFNWLELKRHSNEQPEAILLLTYALTKKYNTYIGNDFNQLRQTLFINHIPNYILQRNFLKSSFRGISTKYKCKEPQSYFICDSFLTALVPLRYKIEYIYILSKRAINDNSTKIPRIIFDQDFSSNPFIKTTEEYYNLYLEYTKSINLPNYIGENTQW